MLRVQRRQCETCIYRDDSALNIKQLEAQIADPRMQGHFKGHRICHHTQTTLCALASGHATRTTSTLASWRSVLVWCSWSTTTR